MKLKKQEIAMAVIIWDTVYKSISRRYVQFESTSDLEKEEIVGNAVNKIVVALNKTLLKEIDEQLEDIDRINILWHLVENAEKRPLVEPIRSLLLLLAN